MTHETPEPTAEWDKVFPRSDAVDREKVAFRTRFGITLYRPKGAEGELPALAVAGPFGAVKEQCSGLYAQTMRSAATSPSPSTPASPASPAASPAI